MHRISNCQLGCGPENLTGAGDPRHTLQDGRLATSGTLMMVTFSAIRSWCRPTFMNSVAPTTKLDQSANLKKEIIHTAPPEWKVDEVQIVAFVSTVAAGSATLGVLCGLVSSSWTNNHIFRVLKSTTVWP